MKRQRSAAVHGWLASSAVVAVVLAAGYATWVAGRLVSHQSWLTWRLDDAVVVVAAVVVAGCGWRLTWIALATVIEVIRTRGRVSPDQGGRWRKVVVTACLWVMGGAVAAPALAAPVLPHPGWVDGAVSVSAQEVDAIQTGESDQPLAEVTVVWPVSQDQGVPPQAEPPAEPAPQPRVATAPVAASNEALDEAGSYTVQRGDSLWRITAQLLGEGASEGDIAAAWPVLYQHNRSTVGGNPHLIHPGQVLAIPQELAS